MGPRTEKRMGPLDLVYLYVLATKFRAAFMILGRNLHERLRFVPGPVAVFRKNRGAASSVGTKRERAITTDSKFLLGKLGRLSRPRKSYR